MNAQCIAVVWKIAMWAFERIKFKIDENDLVCGILQSWFVKRWPHFASYAVFPVKPCHYTPSNDLFSFYILQFVESMRICSKIFDQ